MEKGGVKTKDILVNKNPFPREKCPDLKCPLCKGDFGDLKMDCNVNNTGYRWICQTCKKNDNKVRVYEGKTSRSIRIRSQEHLKAYQNKKQNSVMYKHQFF